MGASLSRAVPQLPLLREPQFQSVPAPGPFSSDPECCGRGRWPRDSIRTGLASPPVSSCLLRGLLTPSSALLEMVFRTHLPRCPSPRLLSLLTVTTTVRWLSFEGTCFHKKQTLYMVSDESLEGVGAQGCWPVLPYLLRHVGAAGHRCRCRGSAQSPNLSAKRLFERPHCGVRHEPCRATQLCSVRPRASSFGGWGRPLPV